MTVVDASVVVEILLRTKKAHLLEARLFDVYEPLYAPCLIDIEVAQVIRRYFFTGDLSAERGRLALLDLQNMPIQRFPHDVFIVNLWEMRDNFTMYDAAYVALAQVLSATFITCDRRLAKVARQRIEVEVF